MPVKNKEQNDFTQIKYIGNNPSYTAAGVRFEKNKKISELIPIDIAEILIQSGKFEKENEK